MRRAVRVQRGQRGAVDSARNASVEADSAVRVLPEGGDVALEPVCEGAGRAAEDPLDVGADSLLGGVGFADGVEGGLDYGLGHELQHLCAGLVAGLLDEPDRLA
jgi:hypothetical protein